MLQVTEVVNAGGDILIVRGLDPAQPGVIVEAQGWVSALTSHYDPADVGTDGQPRIGAKPRAMTATEIGEYASSLLSPVAAAETQIAFTAR